MSKEPDTGRRAVGRLKGASLLHHTVNIISGNGFWLCNLHILYIFMYFLNPWHYSYTDLGIYIYIYCIYIPYSRENVDIIVWIPVYLDVTSSLTKTILEFCRIFFVLVKSSRYCSVQEPLYNLYLKICGLIYATLYLCTYFCIFQWDLLFNERKYVEQISYLYKLSVCM
jgi:hypothetical protein